MSICIEYTSILLKKVYKITTEDVGEKMELYCWNKADRLKTDIKNCLLECRNTREGENRIYDCLLKLKKDKNYFRLIQHLNEVKQFLILNQELTAKERSDVENLELFISGNVKVVGFSGTTIKRIMGSNGCWGKEVKQKIEYMQEYLFLPELRKNRELSKILLDETKKFMLKKEDIARKTPNRDAYRGLIYEDDNVETPEEYLRSIFDILELIDDFYAEQPPLEEEIKETLDVFVRRACKNYDTVLQEMEKNIWVEVMPDIRAEVELYEKINGNSRDMALKSPQFICIGLYHIGHALMKYQVMDIGFERVAMKLCSYGSLKCFIVLHPTGAISAPCGLMGNHIFVGAGSILESGCYLEENVVIAGCPNREDDEEMEFTATIVGEGTTIKKGAILIAGVHVGSGCIISENAVLVRGKVEDDKLVEKEGIVRDLWKDDYLENGGYSFGRE